MTGRGWSFGSAEEVARREQVHIPKYLDGSFSKFCNMIGQMCGFSWAIHVQLAFIAMGVSLVNKYNVQIRMEEHHFSDMLKWRVKHFSADIEQLLVTA